MEIWHKVRGYLAGGVALVACPCHLVLTLPLLLALTAGTAVGAFLSDNLWVVISVSVLLFAGGLILAYRWIGEGRQACSLPAPTQKNQRRSIESGSEKGMSLP